MTALWVVPFVWIFGGKTNRKRLRYIRKAHGWYALKDGGYGLEYLFNVELPEIYRHRQGECLNYSWCIQSRLDPDYESEIPVPEYLKLSEVTQGWFMASAPAVQWTPPAWTPLPDPAEWVAA